MYAEGGERGIDAIQPQKGPANIPARKAGYGEERRRPPANRAGGRRRGSAVVPAVKAGKARALLLSFSLSLVFLQAICM